MSLFWRERDYEIQGTWEYQAAEAGDLRRYLDFYGSKDHETEAVHSLLCLILEAAEDVLRNGGADTDPRLLRLPDIISRQSSVHCRLFDYWCNWQESIPENCFLITLFIRKHHRKYDVPPSDTCSRCRWVTTFREETEEGP